LHSSIPAFQFFLRFCLRVIVAREQCDHVAVNPESKLHVINQRSTLKAWVEGYIRHAGRIGALYGLVPTILYFGGAFLFMPFRSVYVLRMMLCLLLAGFLGAYLNRFGLKIWLLKHRSPEGPGTVLDGLLIGAAVGVGTALLPPLTALIATHHLEDAKWFIIGTWVVAAAAGAIIGGIFAAIGRTTIERHSSGPT
jgi:hypothetical protein